MYLYAAFVLLLPPPPQLPTPISLKSLFFFFFFCVWVTKAKPMKQNLHYCALLIFLIFLIHSSRLSARSLAAKQGKEDVKINETENGEPFVQMEGSESMSELMGLEVCDSGDEECLKRRIISQAHLDYIYTQHHKP